MRNFFRLMKLTGLPLLMWDFQVHAEQVEKENSEERDQLKSIYEDTDAWVSGA